ncbi:MAG: squalene synthase HpnD [Acidimicrobiia bacterium]|nr:squalene synthase HpnD [Acidimicrobiia bacterium]MYC57972.1 squalene synthase HpnD [Acidimicrobiia bacterium]MYG94660.1 squalene synthase HpnD [Acidimicrobiia bacterium]MYI31079.1 squalene synthase HpnD [Acidimicrobiia bacterium]
MRAQEAYRCCEEITWKEARNFAYGIRLLPKPKRQAMSALYAMARRIDDVGDGPFQCEEKLVRLKKLRSDIAELVSGRLSDPEDPVLVGLSASAVLFTIPLEVLNEIVQGCEQDAVGTEYQTIEDTKRYCRLVAGSVGRLSLGIFGTKDRPDVAAELADELGVALQLTNILRDIVEDRAMGRVYLPAEDIARFRCAPDLTGPIDALGRLVAFEVRRAEGHFVQGLKLLDMLDYRSRACVGAMAGIYRRLLVRIAASPTQVFAGRVSLTTKEKLGVAVRSLAGVRISGVRI